MDKDLELLLAEEKNRFENLDWLELETIPTDIQNPLLRAVMSDEPVDEMVKIMSDHQYLHFAVFNLLGVELAPYQLVILDMLWTKKMPMLIMSRGGSKSFMLSVYSLLRMIFHPACKVIIVGASFRQSKAVFDYMVDLWDKAPVLRDIAGKHKKMGPRREVDRCEFRVGDSRALAIPVGDGSKIRGLRANYILCDEFASLNEEIFNVVVQGFGVVESGPIAKMKENANVKKLKEMGVWNEEMEKLRNSRAGGNQIVLTGTAYYAFNHFYKFYQKWRAIVNSKGDNKKLAALMQETEGGTEGLNWKDYAVLRIPYTSIPDGILSKSIIAQAKTTMNTSQFLMEYGACFIADSNGFYKRSTIEQATTNKPIKTASGEIVQFHAQRTGTPDKSYVLAIDPAADSDNAAMILLELNTDHRKIAHCWTTNRKRYNKYKEYMRLHNNIKLDDDYYNYLAKKIRKLMREFRVEHIIMDKNGGGIAIAEALSNRNSCLPDELPIYTVIDPEKPVYEDIEDGLHILQLLSPTADINTEANHGMLKDFQDKVLLFPLFDTVEMEKAIQLDKMNDEKLDTYERLVQEIEDLKNEITTIVCTPSSVLGKETFDTPEIKGEGTKRGRLRKDRYSALLYANYYARNKSKTEPFRVIYKALGGTKETITQVTPNSNQGMYYGLGVSRFGPDFRKYRGGTSFRKVTV